MPTHCAGLAGRHGRAVRAREATRAARDRGRRAGASARVARAAPSARSATSSTFSFHPNKNMTTIEGGALVVNDAAEARARRGAALPRHPRLPDGTRDVAYRRRQVQHARRQRARRRRAARAAARRSSRARRALVERYFARFATRPARASCRRARGDDDGHSVEHVLRAAAARRAAHRRARQFRDALDARGIGTGISYEALHLSTLGRALRLSAKATSRTPSASRARP